jgi:hypothetical protein
MGYMVELNTLLRVPLNFNLKTLVVGKKYTITIDRERAFPLHLAILLIDKDWNFYGYCVAHQIIVNNLKTTIEFEVLSLFSPEEKLLYRTKFLEAAKKTGEV